MLMKPYIYLFGLLLASAGSSFSQTPITIKDTTTRHGPEKGSLIIIGGGGATPEIWTKFTELAGGKDKGRIVVITAAAGDSGFYKTDAVELIKKETGIRNVTLLHTNSLTEANSEKFVAPIRAATGIYFVGGRQWRIADSYLNTLTHKAFQEVLERGGVISGTSAGASIQASFLWRGDTKGAHILIGDHTQGLGFLKNAAIDQHLMRRNRQFDLIEFIRQSPEIIGIGLDEATAIVVQKDIFEVIGRSYVAVYDYNTIIAKRERRFSDGNGPETNYQGPFFLLKQGQKYDLRERKVIAGQ
jgi:cyanophycinase